MDVLKQKPTKKVFNTRVLLVIGTALALLVLGAYVFQSSRYISINSDEILVAEVMRGDLEVKVEGYGVLESERQQLITSLTAATVKEVLYKPGAVVTADSIIVKLENAELDQQALNATQELELAEANLRQLIVSHKREHLNENAIFSETKARLEAARLRREAHEALVQQGIVSKLSYQESVLEEQLLEKQVQILQQRLKQLDEVHKEAINIEKGRIEQRRSILQTTRRRVDGLNVRAGFEGVVQRLSVEVGQSLSPGQEIALIGSVSELVALIRVPQNQATQVVVGQHAVIDTRRDKIEGVVSRIDPVVNDNTISVEVALQGDLPQSARPNANVDGTIVAETLKNFTYIERPPNVRSYSEVELYHLNSSSDTARLTKVKLGKQAGRFVEIISGAEVGERFIVSDVSRFRDASSQLKITF